MIFFPPGKRKQLKILRKSSRRGTNGKSNQSFDRNVRLSPSSTENSYYRKVLKLQSTVPHWKNLFSKTLHDEHRMSDWIRIEVLGEPLLQKFAWAVPDQHAINILKKFSPIIEIGAGKGYWAYLMRQQGIEITPYDIEPQSKSWTNVKKGDPSVLVSNRKKLPSNSTLFLCYPDEGSSVGIECLTNIVESTDALDPFCQYIVHVGELIHTGCASGSPQAPWGRSSSPDFQVKLSEHYHCILVHPLLSFPFSRDFLTIWKRTATINMKGRQGTDDDANDEDDEDDDEWADIPDNERLFNSDDTIATPAYRHLFE